MKSKSSLTATVLTGIAICGTVGAMTVAGRKKNKAKKITRKAGKQIEAVSSMLQSIAAMTK